MKASCGGVLGRSISLERVCIGGGGVGSWKLCLSGCGILPPEVLGGMGMSEAVGKSEDTSSECDVHSVVDEGPGAVNIILIQSHWLER